MTISKELLAESVVNMAQEMKWAKNPYISLEQLESLCQDNLLDQCLQEVANYSLRYAETVCRFEQIVARGQISNEDGTRDEIEQVRSNIHDATIDSINILSRNLKVNGKDNNWILKVASAGRAGYGKLAILLAFEIARRS